MEKVKEEKKNDPFAKWLWMCRYCKKQNLPPHKTFAWNMAEKSYKMIEEKK